MKKKESMQEIVYAALLLAAVVFSFLRFSMQTVNRIEEQNKNYAADAALLKSEQIDDELNNAMRQIKAYAYFVGESLTEPVVTAQMLKEIEENSYFDAVLFTDVNGIDYASDGRTADVTDREVYRDGIGGSSGNEVVFDSNFFDGTMVCFYAPVRVNGQIIGVLRGA
ncbi:MAG: cache domain-containing protein, partial [Oscillospiraceae bacterium]|nr:cache domain-containing protein [Oscillospiraceae bacterium]